MGGNISEYLFGQAIIAVALPMSTNQLCIQASRSSTSISCAELGSGLVLLVADSHDFFSAVLRSTLHIYMG